MKKTIYSIMYIVWGSCFVAGFFIDPETLRSLNLWTFIPTILLLITAFITKSYFIPFLLSSLLALTYVYKCRAPSTYIDILLDVCSNTDNIWLLLDIMMIGGLISIIEKSGVTELLADVITNRVNTEKAELGAIIIFSFLLSFDDYFFPSVVSSISIARKNSRDEAKRDSLAFLSRSATISFANFNPVSWPIYTMSLLVTYGVAKSVNVYSIYYKISLFMFFPLFILGTQLVKYLCLVLKRKPRIARKSEANKMHLKALVYLFFPVILHMASSLVVGDTLKPLFLTVFTTSVFHACRKQYGFLEIPQIIIAGINHMMEVCIVIVMSLVFSEALNRIFFIEHSITVISTTTNFRLIPFMTFAFFSATEFMFSLNWSLWLIVFPVLIKVSEITGANLFLTLGAILSAGILGSISCIYSDSSVLSVTNFSLDVRSHSWYTLMQIIPSFVLSAALYLVLGFIL